MILLTGTDSPVKAASSDFKESDIIFSTRENVLKEDNNYSVLGEDYISLKTAKQKNKEMYVKVSGIKIKELINLV